MANLDRGSFYITNGSVNGDTISGTIVRIDQQKVDHNLIKQLIEFNRQTPDFATEPLAWLIDLKGIKHIVSIQGVLVTDSDSDAYTKKQNLMVLAGYGGTAEDGMMSGQTPSTGFVIGVYGLSAKSSQHKVTGNIVKLMITETPGVISDGTTTDEKIPMAYAVQLQIAVGKNRATE